MNRVTSLKKSDGTPIELTQTYTVAANDFMATGGDRFTGFNDPAIVDKKDTGMLLRDVFIESAKTQKTITAEIDNRILPGDMYYVYAEYVQSATETTVLKSVKVIARICLNVRDGASLSSNILGALPYGSVVQVVGVSGDWYRIIYNGSYSYVYAKYTK